MTSRTKAKGPASAGTDPDHVITNPTKDMEMNVTTGITPAAAAKVYAACTAAGNCADLIAFVGRTAKEHAYKADDEAFPKFHEIRLALDGAERLLREHAESLDILSSELSVGGAAQ